MGVLSGARERLRVIMKDTIDALARTFALLGGLVLSLLIVMTCISIIGRATGIGPIDGDFEIVEAGMAFTIFAFLPLCQLHGAHASVDIFMSAMPARLAAGIRALVEVVFAAVLILITWQLCEGALSKYHTGQTTFLLEFPVWWSYAACVVAMVAAAITGVYVAWMRCVSFATGVPMPPDEKG